MQSIRDCGLYAGSWNVSSSWFVVFAPGWIVISVVSSDGTYIVRRLASLSFPGFSSRPSDAPICPLTEGSAVVATPVLPCPILPIGTRLDGLFPSNTPRLAGACSSLFSNRLISSPSTTSSKTFVPTSLLPGLLGRACANSCWITRVYSIWLVSSCSAKDGSAVV